MFLGMQLLLKCLLTYLLTIFKFSNLGSFGCSSIDAHTPDFSCPSIINGHLLYLLSQFSCRAKAKDLKR